MLVNVFFRHGPYMSAITNYESIDREGHGEDSYYTIQNEVSFLVTFSYRF